MIRALVTGTLHLQPVARTSASGKPFTTAKLRADGKDGASVWCSVIAFGELAERLASLPANATLSVSGRAEVSAWSDKQGEPKAGLSLVVDEIATLKGKPKPTERNFAPTELDSKPSASPNHLQPRRSARQPTGDFDDLDMWQP